MANKVLLKKSAQLAKVPLDTDLDYGELALNYNDGLLYFKNTLNSIVSIPSASATATLTNKTLVTPKIAAINSPAGSGLTLTTPAGYGVAINVGSLQTVFEIDGSLTIPGTVIASKGVVSTPQIASVNTAVNIDLSAADNFHFTLTGNTVFTVSNAASKIGSSGNIILKQDATGGRTFTKATEMKTPIGGAAIAQWTSANSLSVLSYYVVDANTLIINYIGNFA